MDRGHNSITVHGAARVGQHDLSTISQPWQSESKAFMRGRHWMAGRTVHHRNVGEVISETFMLVTAGCYLGHA